MRIATKRLVEEVGGMTKFEEEFKRDMDFVKEIMKLMENRGFTMGEAGACAAILAHEVEKNNKSKLNGKTA